MPRRLGSDAPLPGAAGVSVRAGSGPAAPPVQGSAGPKLRRTEASPGRSIVPPKLHAGWGGHAARACDADPA
ncbi:MAG: hypothetical protein ACF788_07395, partial [Novipirellula sp. JB048]